MAPRRNWVANFQKMHLDAMAQPEAGWDAVFAAHHAPAYDREEQESPSRLCGASAGVRSPSARELLARMNTVLRRTQPDPASVGDVLAVGDVILDGALAPSAATER